jgi:hypothetical protein
MGFFVLGESGGKRALGLEGRQAGFACSNTTTAICSSVHGARRAAALRSARQKTVEAQPQEISIMVKFSIL